MSGSQAEENMAGSNTAMTSPDDTSNETAIRNSRTPNGDDPSATSQAEHECSECQSDGDGTPANHDDGASGGSTAGSDPLPGLAGTASLLAPLLAGDAGNGEPLDPATDLVAEICSGNLQTLDPGLGLGELGDTCADCLDKVAGPGGEVTGALSNAVVTNTMALGDALGVPATTHAIACTLASLGLGNVGSHEGGGVVADVVNLPHDILSGANIGTSIGDVLSDAAGTINMESGVVGAVFSDLGTPLLGANLDSDGQSSSGSYIASADVGPQQDNGLLVNLLAPGGQSGHAADANAIEGRSVVDANLLNSGDPITFPALGGVGTDSLEGLLGGSVVPQVADTGAVTTPVAIDDVIAALSVDGLLDTSHQTSQPNSLLHSLV